VAPGQDILASLNKLNDVAGVSQAEPKLQIEKRPGRPRGKLTTEKVCKAVRADSEEIGFGRLG